MTDNHNITPAELLARSARDLDEAGYHLNHNGIFKRTEFIAEQDQRVDVFNFNSERLHLLLSIIPLIMTPSERRTMGSYTAKHIVEKFFSQRYVSNGEFILCANALGYRMKNKMFPPNAEFYAKCNVSTFPELRYPFVVGS
jgi:hypothetical protein